MSARATGQPPHYDTPQDMPRGHGLPPLWRTGWLERRDGVRLRWGHAMPDRLGPGLEDRVSVGTVVIVPGFTEPMEKYAEVINDLNDRCLDVWILDPRGQGGSDRYYTGRYGARPGGQGYGADANDLELFLTHVVRPVPDMPVFLLGHSMGGLIGLHHLHHYPGRFQAAALSAPMTGLKVSPPMRVVAFLMIGLSRLFRFGHRYLPGAKDWNADPEFDAGNNPVASDPVRALVHHKWFVAHPELRIGDPTFSWLDHAFQGMKAINAPGVPEAIKTPVLIGSAGDERNVDPASHEALAERLPNGFIERYPMARHELFMEPDDIRSHWLEQIDRFFQPFIQEACSHAAHAHGHGRLSALPAPATNKPEPG